MARGDIVTMEIVNAVKFAWSSGHRLGLLCVSTRILDPAAGTAMKRSLENTWSAAR